MEEKNTLNGESTPTAIEYHTSYSTNKESDSDWKSGSIDELAKALAKAQSEIKGAATNAKNSFFKSGYADLHAVIDACMPHLNKHGLSVVQGNVPIDKHIMVTTTLLHESGQWIRSEIKMPLKEPTAHGVGSACTYGRRYGLSAMVGVAQFDDDGNANSPQKQKGDK